MMEHLMLQFADPGELIERIDLYSHDGWELVSAYSLGTYHCVVMRRKKV